jgi:ATP-binding cassette, subfamily G (WHITE), member 2, SNQ2
VGFVFWTTPHSNGSECRIVALLVRMTFVFVALFCGVLQPLSSLPKFWHFVHYASPFTWLLEYIILPTSTIKILELSRELLSNVIHNTTVTCNRLEINIFQPPLGKTCGQLAGPFLSFGIGALYNQNATANCEYCRFSTWDQYLKMLNFSWSHRWRILGFM